jgi:hypothetical protein
MLDTEHYPAFFLTLSSQISLVWYVPLNAAQHAAKLK